MSTVKLKDITSKIGSGATPRGGKNSYKQAGISLIRSLNVYDYLFDKNNLAYIDKKQAENLSNVEVQKNDILLNITGASVARCCLVPKEVLPARVNQHVSIIRMKDQLADPYYIFYKFVSPEFKQYLLNLAQGGATREALTKGTIENLEIELPTVTTQRKIASILSAYDDLIENNTRRIKILEEMAQTIYKEWFVNFRFPRHEKVKFVDSPLGKIPGGWEVKTLKDIATYLIDGDWVETKDQGGNDYRLLQISNIGLNRFVETQNFRFIAQETFEKLNCSEIKEGDILIARMPTPIGRAWLVTKTDWEMITAVDVAILRPNKLNVNEYFLVYFINSPFNLERAQNYSTGTTRPRLTRRDLATFSFASPPLEIQNQFGKLCESLHSLINDLISKNKNLFKTRDLLLPKLMSGEVEV